LLRSPRGLRARTLIGRDGEHFPEISDNRATVQARAGSSVNTARFRAGLEKAGFKVLKGETPIMPVMLGEARLAQQMAAELDRLGVYVAGFFFPVVPRGAARIRTQMSAALSEADVDFAIEAFAEAGRKVGAG
jgi:glycine C-acetyltransferase